jgi:predicted Zn-dependent peptidase
MHEIEEKVSEIGGQMNAYTSNDETVYYINCPYRHKDLAINILLQVVYGTQFSDNEIEKEKIIVSEERSLHGVRPEAKNILKVMLPATNPYVQDPIGTSKSINKISNADLREFNNEHYNLNNSYFILSGPRSYQGTVLKLIKKKLLQMSRKARSSYMLGEETNDIVDPCIYNTFEYSLLVIRADAHKIDECTLGFRSFAKNNRYNLYMHFVNFLLHHDLMKVFREKHAYVYDIKVFAFDFKYIGVNTISFTTSHENISAIIGKVIRFIERKYVSKTMNKKLFETEKNKYLNFFEFNMKDYHAYSVFIKSTIYLPTKIDADQYREIIRKMTPDDLRSICKYVFDREKMGCIIKSNNAAKVKHIKQFKYLVSAAKLNKK